MASISDILMSLFQGAGASPEEAQAKVAQYSSHPDAASALAPFDVHTSDNTVTQDGNLPTTPPSYPAALTMGDMATPESRQLPPAPPMQEPTTPEMPPTDTSAAPAAMKAPKSMAPTPAAPMPAPANDEATRKAGLDDAMRRKHLTDVGGVVAGLGDTVGGALAGLGVNTKTDAQDKVLTRGQEDYEQNKKEVESHISADPNSDASKAARQIVLQIAPQMAKQPNFLSMSDQEIRNKLPMVDAMMRAQSSKDTRELTAQMRQDAQRASKDAKDVALSEKTDQFNQRRWERFGAAVNPMNAGSRRALGVAATNNMRADRLLQTAMNKNITSQDYSNMIADLQGIYKGGVPDQVMLAHGDYPSLQRKAGQILGMLSGNPSGVHTPQLLEHLKSLTQELKDVDNKVINDNLGFNRVIFDDLEKDDPAKFQKAMASLESMTVSPPEGGMKSTDAPAMPSSTGERKTSSGFTYTVGS